MENDYHAPDTLEIDVMTEEAVADLMFSLIQETEVRAARDMPAGTETLEGGTSPTTAKLKADHPTGSTQVAIDHQLPTLGIVQETNPPHAVVRLHPDAV